MIFFHGQELYHGSPARASPRDPKPAGLWPYRTAGTGSGDSLLMRQPGGCYNRGHTADRNTITMITPQRLLAVICCLVLAESAHAQNPREPSDWGNAQILFSGKLSKAQAGPVANSMPPIYSYRLTFDVKQMYRGDLGKDKGLTLHYSARQRKPPALPTGKTYLVAAETKRGRTVAIRLAPATDKLLAMATQAAALPLGWKAQEDKVISPWAGLGKAAWKTTFKAGNAPVCATTARPALLAGGSITFAVKPVPPPTAIKWTNPDGDGEYNITITNPTKKPIRIPALLSNAKGDVLWDESLVIQCQRKAYPAPRAEGVSGKVTATVLKPGESLSHVINVLLLKGPQWPQGGYRIEFQFCLGERSKTQSLYFMTRHHGKLRDALLPSP